jgi:GNAT superfamily N-acetyltransferase
MNIRLATKKDKEQVLHLFDEFSTFLKAEDVPSKVGGKIFDEIVSRKDTMIFVAEENNKLVGLITFYLLPNIRHGFRRGHIEDFFVTSIMQGKGVGTALFSAVKKYCIKNNIKVIKLDSNLELPEAHKFYEEMGGKTTERFFRFDL